MMHEHISSVLDLVANIHAHHILLLHKLCLHQTSSPEIIPQKKFVKTSDSSMNAMEIYVNRKTS